MGVDYSSISGYGIYATAKQMFDKFNLKRENEVEETIKEESDDIHEYYQAEDDEDFKYDGEDIYLIEEFVEDSEYKDVVEIKEYGSHYSNVIDYVLLFKPKGRFMSKEFIESFRKFERFLNEFNFKNQIEFIKEILEH